MNAVNFSGLWERHQSIRELDLSVTDTNQSYLERMKTHRADTISYPKSVTGSKLAAYQTAGHREPRS